MAVNPSHNEPSPGSFAKRRTSSFASVRTAGSTRVGQIAREAIHAEPPLGAWRAIAQETSQAPTLGEIREGSYTADGWSSHPRSRSSSNASARRQSGRSPSSGALIGATLAENVESEKREEFPTLAEEVMHSAPPQHDGAREQVEGETKSPNVQTTTSDSLSPSSTITKPTSAHPILPSVQRVHSSGYIPPPKLPWRTTCAISLQAFWKWFLTPAGFLITLYGLNVVAWGGMLFLLLCNAAPAMCWAHDPTLGWIRDCNHIDSSRRIWLETDSQILNALFCVTGFGLLPWRFRDLYHLLRWHLCNEHTHGSQRKLHGLRSLAARNTDWLRLPGSETLDSLSTAAYLAANPITTIPPEPSAPFDPRLPHPTSKSPPPPLTGVRAPPTQLWKLDFFIWSMAANTFLQGALSGVMWGLNRYDRPSWTTGFLIAAACGVAGAGGGVTAWEGRRVRRVEGVGVGEGVGREWRRLEGREEV